MPAIDVIRSATLIGAEVVRQDGKLGTISRVPLRATPLSIWLMGLSARVFGFSSFSMLLPQAVCTVGSVAKA